MLFGIIVAVVLVGLVVWGFGSYNGLIKKRNLVQESWRQIDVELKRRHDLIPNLVETVKGYATHEKGTLEAVMRARSAAMSGGQTPEQLGRSEGELSAALGRLIAVSEAYPDLKANANFAALQQELSSTEDRIASGRRYYNACVRDLNTSVESVPSNFIANYAKIGKEQYFEAEAVAQQAPTIDFGAGGGTVAGPGIGGQGYAPPVTGSAPQAQLPAQAPTYGDPTGQGQPGQQTPPPLQPPTI